jgi:hypothetical protein
VSNTAELDAAKDHLAETLSTARDVTKTAVVEEIAPAVVAVVGAARDASGPLQAEAVSRAGDAITALRGSEAMATVNDTLASIGENVTERMNGNGSTHHRRRWPVVVTVLGAGAAAFAVIRTRGHRMHSGHGSFAPPTPMPTPANAEAQPTVIPDEDEYE